MSLSDIQVEELLISAEQHLNDQPLRKSTIIEGPSVVANRSVVRSPEVHLKALPALATNTADNAGPAWFGLPKAKMTPELKRDLQVLRLRGALNPKIHYKKSGTKSLVPRYCHVGEIVEGPTDFILAG
ncbi:unnamed protein product [Parascedosporium putredinis]|uniref:Fcf2 pre-rRNA processing C-terminal domain-containing protein n=1 Tax=Parascedosporium putredinis TaxID=1442378 RepID=A0A9P1GWY0_9PEZI|nr:unnamed protein product [Parascedosporium putredinis]CAI7988525.1 unnamed protein product [Parascedosporium putredinis]